MKQGGVKSGAGWCLTVLVCSTLCAACSRNEQTVESAPQAATASQQVKPHLTLVQYKDSLKNAYQLMPDQRCITAATVLDSWLRAGSERQPTLTYDSVSSSWKIRFDQSEAGSLAALPDFDNCLQLLSRMIVASGAETPDAAANAVSGVMQFAEPDELLEQLRGFDSAADSRTLDGSQLRSMARGFTYLYLQSIDLMNLDDRLAGIALALDAWASAKTGAVDASTQALLADLMGYGREARVYSAQLEATDPVRLYVNHDDKGLFSMASKGRENALLRYLALRRYAENGDYAHWLFWIRSYPSERQRIAMPVWQTAMLQGTFLQQGAAEQMSYFIVAQMHFLAQENTDGNWSREIGITQQIKDIVSLMNMVPSARYASRPLVDEFEDSLATWSRRFTGRIVDARAAQAFYRSYFYSDLYRVATFKLQLQGAPDRARNWLQAMSTGSAHETWQAFKSWFELLILAEEGKAQPGQLINALDTPGPFGAAPRLDLLELLEDRYLSYGNASSESVVLTLSRQLDSRPDQALQMANEVRSLLYEFDLSERLIAHVVAVGEANDPKWVVWLAGMQGDVAGLRAVLDSPVDLRIKRRAVEWIERLTPEDNAGIAEAYRKTYEEGNNDSSTVEWYVKYLIENAKYNEARRSALLWLDLKRPDSGLQRAELQTQIAKAHDLEGQYDLAWRSIQPALQSYKYSALSRGAWILSHLGRMDEAQKMWDAAISRYGDTPHVRTEYLSYLWSQKRHSEAAQWLMKWAPQFQMQAWVYEIAPAFYEGTKDLAPTDMLAAVDSLRQAGASPSLSRYLSKPYEFKGRVDLAWQIRERIGVEHGATQLSILADDYKYLRKLKGKEEAAEWLRPQIPTQVLGLAALIFYEEGQADLLWDLIPYPERDRDPNWIWLLRAAAAVRYDAGTPEHRQALADYYHDAKQDYVHTMGRYLLGFEPESALLAKAVDENYYELAYVIGLRHQCNGDLRGASDWYHAVLRLISDRKGEHRWTLRELYRWYGEAKLLDKIDSGCPKTSTITSLE